MFFIFNNFANYVGLVDDLTIHYPSNGIGYDSWIYRHYFANKEVAKATADDNTKKAIELLDTIVDISEATNDNKEDILTVYDS